MNHTLPLLTRVEIAISTLITDWGWLMLILLVVGGVLWAATTLVVKATRLIHAPAEKALAYQVAMSIPILTAGAWMFGERITHMPGLLAWGLMIYQTVWIVGTTFVIWLFLIKSYSASKLSAFTFLTPLFGVIGGYFIMHDTLSLAFAGAALLVMAGLFLVNRRTETATASRRPVTKT